MAVFAYMIYINDFCVKRVDLILLSFVHILSHMFPNDVQTQRDEERICSRQIDRFSPAMAGFFCNEDNSHVMILIQSNHQNKC